jgi:rhamnulokinase
LNLKNSFFYEECLYYSFSSLFPAECELIHQNFKNTIDVDDKKYMLSDTIIEDLKKDLKTEKLGEILCGVLNSLALRIKKTKITLEEGLKINIKKVHMIGGGIKNELLCKKISETLGVAIFTGPVEGTAFGNAVVQMLSKNMIKNEDEKKALLSKSIRIKKY